MESSNITARGAPPGTARYNYGLHRHFTNRQNLRKPPYAKRLDPESRQSVIILTGTRAWDRAKSETWFPGCKIVLPYGDDPCRYAWPVDGRDVAIFSFGAPESLDRLIVLSVALIHAGATAVVWACGRCPSALYKPGRPPA